MICYNLIEKQMLPSSSSHGDLCYGCDESMDSACAAMVVMSEGIMHVFPLHVSYAFCNIAPQKNFSFCFAIITPISKACSQAIWQFCQGEPCFFNPLNGLEALIWSSRLVMGA